MLKLTFITSNENKYREAKETLPGLDRLGIELPEIQSLESKEIIGPKLLAAKERVADFHDRILLVEDASNVFEGCGRLPGTLIKYFIKELGGAPGLYKFAQAFEVKRAVVRAVMGLLVPGQAPVFFDGEVRGQIVALRGQSKFDFDPIFQPDGFSKTFAEMTVSEKNAISHRGIALRKVREYLQNELKWQF